jgi:hypothetical protein
MLMRNKTAGTLGAIYAEKMRGYAWGKGMLQHTRARQELASWPTWKDLELSEDRNGGKDLQFANDSTSKTR